MPVRLGRLVTALLLSLTLAIAGSGLSPSAGPRVAPAAAQPAPGCDLGTQLVTNGSFERPVVTGPFPSIFVTPDGWSGGPVEVQQFGGGPDGLQGAVINPAPITQQIPTAGRGGQTLTLRAAIYSLGNTLSVTFGDQPAALSGTSTGFAFSSVTFTVPANPPATTPLTLVSSLQSIDAVSLTVTGCPAPTVVPAALTVETTKNVASGAVPFTATSSTGAALTASVALADTPVNGSVVIGGSAGAWTVVYTPTAGYAGPDTFTVSVTDANGTTRLPVTVTVIDTNVAPVFDPASVPTDLIVEGDTLGGATVAFNPTATDADVIGTDKRVDVTCANAAGDSTPVTSATVFPVGTTLVTCTATDTVPPGTGPTAPVTASFTVTVTDTAGPTITVPAAITVNPTTANGAVVTYTVTATDTVEGPIVPSCAPTSGSAFPIGTTTVTCTATDARGNAATPATFTVTVRAPTGPVGIVWIGGPQPGATYSQATLPAAPTCTATFVTGPAFECLVFGYSTTPGRHTLTARARDAAGNTIVETRSYTVSASAPPATATPRPGTTPKPTATPKPTDTPRPTATPRPPQSTATPRPTERPRTTPTTAPAPSEPTVRPTPRPRG